MTARPAPQQPDRIASIVRTMLGKIEILLDTIAPPLPAWYRARHCRKAACRRARLCRHSSCRAGHAGMTM